jgi:hypothetical protein
MPGGCIGPTWDRPNGGVEKVNVQALQLVAWAMDVTMTLLSDLDQAAPEPSGQPTVVPTDRWAPTSPTSAAGPSGFEAQNCNCY